MSSLTPSPTPLKTRTGSLGPRSVQNGGILRRAALVALILGSILTLLNQWDAVVGRAEIRLLPLVLVYLTPFVVVMISQVLGLRQATADVLRKGIRLPLEERFPATVLSHGIPARAVVTGLMVGSVNASITLAGAYVTNGDPSALPLAAIVQAYSLPVLFGALSQAISYRRTTRAYAQPSFSAGSLPGLGETIRLGQGA